MSRCPILLLPSQLPVLLSRCPPRSGLEASSRNHPKSQIHRRIWSQIRRRPTRLGRLLVWTLSVSVCVQVCLTFSLSVCLFHSICFSMILSLFACCSLSLPLLPPYLPPSTLSFASSSWSHPFPISPLPFLPFLLFLPWLPLANSLFSVPKLIPLPLKRCVFVHDGIYNSVDYNSSRVGVGCIKFKFLKGP